MTGLVTFALSYLLIRYVATHQGDENAWARSQVGVLFHRSTNGEKATASEGDGLPQQANKESREKQIKKHKQRGAFGGEDVIVHVHIQKAGGTYFGGWLLDVQYPDAVCVLRENKIQKMIYWENAELIRQRHMNESTYFPCWRKHRDGYRYFQPLFSKRSVGWRCGVHASFGRMLPCAFKYSNTSSVENLKFATIIRNPVDRFISEYLQTINGWKRMNDGYSPEVSIPSDYYCNGTLRQIAFPCTVGKIDGLKSRKDGFTFVWDIVRSITGKNHSDISGREPSLWDYLACPSTYHHNRQTRMLASDQPCVKNDMELYSPPYQQAILKSAQTNLERMAFFGLEDRMYESLKLFEWTFGLLGPPLAPKESKGSKVSSMLHPQSLKLIEVGENLDMELYRHGVKIFEERLHTCGEYCQKF